MHPEAAPGRTYVHAPLETCVGFSQERHPGTPMNPGWNPDATRRDTLVMSISQRLRERTKSLHKRAERSGFVHDLLHGHATRMGYAVYLRSLLPVYQELEARLSEWQTHPAVRFVAWPTLQRRSAIEHDLRTLYGDRAIKRIPLVPAAMLYAARIIRATLVDPALLVARAYVRYLGDLNGRRILRRVFQDRLAIETSALTFFDYDKLPDLSEAIVSYRESIDAAGRLMPDHDATEHEAAMALQLNILLSTAVARS